MKNGTFMMYTRQNKDMNGIMKALAKKEIGREGKIYYYKKCIY